MTQERDYSQMSAQELAVKFRRLFRDFPGSPDLGNPKTDMARVTKTGKPRLFAKWDKARDIMAGRAKSEDKKLIMDTAARLIQRSYLTSPGRQAALIVLGTVYITGTLSRDFLNSRDKRGESPRDSISILLDPEHPGFGGIFGFGRVQEIECEFYNLVFRVLNPFITIFTESSYQFEGCTYSREEILAGYAENYADHQSGVKLSDLLPAWRQELIEKYGGDAVV